MDEDCEIDTSDFLEEDEEYEIDTSNFLDEEEENNTYHDPTEVPETIKYLILGAPKSGNDFITKVFKKLELNIGFEEHGTDGISDWSLVPGDTTFFPSSTTCRNDLTVDKIIHIIKNPYIVISDIWYTNYCILEDTSSDPNMEMVTAYEATVYRMNFLNMYTNLNGIDNCITAYLGWNEAIKELNPEYVIHIENVLEDIKQIPEYKPFELEAQKIVKRLKLSNGIWKKANPELMEKLDAFCVEHKYPKVSDRIK